MATAPPILEIPRSQAISTVRVIDTTSTIHYSTHFFFTEPISSHSDLACPSYSFLVSDSTGKRHVLFDLGIRKDWKTGLPGPVVEGMKKIGAYFDVEEDVVDILDKGAASGGSNDRLPKSSDIEALIWSHHHIDHIGDPTLFPSHVPIVVGPGVCQAILPGFPEDQSSSVPSSCWENRELHEIDFEKDERVVQQVGPFSTAIDYFGDSSFYLVPTPGHEIGHLSGLARVTPTTFIFMGGDAAHHGGMIRPTQYLPLPDMLPLSSSKRFPSGSCSGKVLANLQPNRNGSTTTPFYESADHFCKDKTQAMLSIQAITELDASDNVFVILAHERSLQHFIPLYPNTINDWRDKNLDEKTRWLFVDDFAGSVDEGQ